MILKELKAFLLENQDSTSIDLSGKDIKELPPEIGRLTNLRKLFLERNQLESLPPEIGNLIAPPDFRSPWPSWQKTTETGLTDLAIFILNPAPAAVCNDIQIQGTAVPPFPGQY